MLHKFIRLKFPSIDFDDELLELYVSYVEIDHVISSGGDFDENLWSPQTGSVRVFTRARDASSRSLAQAGFPRPEPVL